MSARSPHIAGGQDQTPPQTPSAETVAAGDGARSHNPFIMRASPRWSEALGWQTHAHMTGLADGAEMALRLALSVHLPEELLDDVPEGVVRQILESDPALLPPAFYRHLRSRAALGLLSAQGGPINDAALPSDLADEITGLGLAFARWHVGQANPHPMRLDLPAHLAAELLMLAGASLTRAMGVLDVVAWPTLLSQVDGAIVQVMAGLDESAMPLARASHMAQRLRVLPGGDWLSHLRGANQPVLILAALADRCGLDLGRVAEAVVHGDAAATVSALAALAGADPASISSLAGMLGVVRADTLATVGEMSPWAARAQLATLTATGELDQMIRRLSGPRAA